MDTIKYQQKIIQKLTENLKELEVVKISLIKEKREYEELLQQNRFNFKEVNVFFTLTNDIFGKS